MKQGMLSKTHSNHEAMMFVCNYHIILNIFIKKLFKTSMCLYTFYLLSRPSLCPDSFSFCSWSYFVGGIVIFVSNELDLILLRNIQIKTFIIT